MTEVVLPWPPKDLSPNARVHWSRRAKAARAYRSACFWLTKRDCLRPAPDGRLHVTIEFIPPDRRQRDRDNLLASIKSGLDGFAEALGVNDSRFDLTIRVAETIGGMVRVRLTSEPA